MISLLLSFSFVNFQYVIRCHRGRPAVPPWTLSGRRRVLIYPALRNLLLQLLLIPPLLGEATAFCLLAVPQPGRGP